jgi:hypothetical protein
VLAQESAQQRAANLRAQLTETQAKQAELQTRLQQLQEDLKPENIERSLQVLAVCTRKSCAKHVAVNSKSKRRAYSPLKAFS